MDKFWSGPNPMKRTLKELDNMERRLNVVLEGCMTPEEIEARKKNKFGNEKKRLTDLLKDIRVVCLFKFITDFQIFLCRKSFKEIQSFSKKVSARNPQF